MVCTLAAMPPYGRLYCICAAAAATSLVLLVTVGSAALPSLPIASHTGTRISQQSSRRPAGRRLHSESVLESSQPPTQGVAIAYDPALELYKSQDGQDKWANDHVFRGATHGVFVDLGCYDGVTYSNTWYFERVLNWVRLAPQPPPNRRWLARDRASVPRQFGPIDCRAMTATQSSARVCHARCQTGICVEPNPDVFPRIATQAGRTSGVQLAVSDHEGSAMFVAAFMRSSLNATAVDYKFLANAGVAPSQVRVDVTTPSALLTGRFSRSTVIDYVNIDVEQVRVGAAERTRVV